MHKASLGFSQSFIIEYASGECVKVPKCPCPSFPLPKTEVLILPTMTNITNHTSETSKIKSTKIEQSSSEMIKQLNLSLLVATQSECGLPTQILVTTKETVTKQTYNSKQILNHTYNT